MAVINQILEAMIQNELGDNQAFVISHHQADSPHRIDVARDETIFIHKINIEVSANFWLEFHSATESRLIEKQVVNPETIIDEIITRHKGSVYFTQSFPFSYEVNYVKLKIVK